MAEESGKPAGERSEIKQCHACDGRGFLICDVDDLTEETSVHYPIVQMCDACGHLGNETTARITAIVRPHHRELDIINMMLGMTSELRQHSVDHAERAGVCTAIEHLLFALRQAKFEPKI
jgi:hypothetical protein